MSNVKNIKVNLNNNLKFNETVTLIKGGFVKTTGLFGRKCDDIYPRVIEDEIKNQRNVELTEKHKNE